VKAQGEDNRLSPTRYAVGSNWRLHRLNAIDAEHVLRSAPAGVQAGNLQRATPIRPGTGRGTPIVKTIGFPLGDRNTHRAAIRRIVRGAAQDLLMRLSRAHGHSTGKCATLCGRTQCKV